MLRLHLRLLPVLAAALASLAAPPPAPAVTAVDDARRDCAAPCRIHVYFDGTGSGRVDASWTEVTGEQRTSCRTTCVISTDFGVDVRVAAVPDPGSYFDRMVSEDCPVLSPTCVFFMDFERNLRVTFGGDGLPAPPPPPPPTPQPPPPYVPPAGAPEPGAATAPAGCTIVGTPGDDDLDATRGDDVICALGGNDHIHVGGGHDVVYAGPGDDVVEVGFGTSLVRAGGGNDRVVGGSLRDRVYGGAGADVLLGGGAGDLLHGGAGRDRLAGGAGPDLLVARDGARDVVSGGAGIDRALVDGRDVVRAAEKVRSLQ